MDKLYGAQTLLSLKNFDIGENLMPAPIIRALVLIKKCAAKANYTAGKLSQKKANSILTSAQKVLDNFEEFAPQFPLKVWQTGSGTQTNMNVNEVLATLSKTHPNDDVNMSQSTNDVFPAALHIASVWGYKEKLKPALSSLISALKRLERKYQNTQKTGRTHMTDATPLTFAQEISGWRGALERAALYIKDSLKYVLRLPLGATAVGTGLNAPHDFGDSVAKLLQQSTGIPFTDDENKFRALSHKDALVNFHAALKNLAVSLFKIANDVRLLASGPRTGLGEITIPENEPGSSIMPGKVNPTQCEALTMVCCEIFGNDTAITHAAAGGQLQLNTYMPLIGFKICGSLTLLAQSIASFTKNCARGIKAVESKFEENLEKSLMNATALTPIIGYDLAAKAVKTAHKNGLTLKQALVKLNIDIPETEQAYQAYQDWLNDGKKT